MNVEEVLSIRYENEYLFFSGIYYLLKGNEIVYVGQARNIYQRLSVHVAERRKDFDSCAFREVEVEKLDDEETLEIINHRPIYNTILPKNNVYKNIKQLASTFGVSVIRIRKHIVMNKLVPISVGGLVFYKVSDFQKKEKDHE